MIDGKDAAVLKAFGRRLKHIRKRHGLSQERLADEVEMSRASIGNIETGNQNVTVTMLARLASALNVTPDVLLASPVKLDAMRLAVYRAGMMLADIRDSLDKVECFLDSAKRQESTQ